jgi:hypothetical protein
MGRSTALYIVRETCQALWSSLENEVLKLPDEKEWLEVAKIFWEKWNFPNCLGALDGKHVAIQSPGHTGSQYFNYKGHHSIILMAVVDANLRFLVLDVGAYGRSSDSSVFASSNFGRALFNGEVNLPPPALLPHASPTSPRLPRVFIADEAFPLKPFLLRPFSGRGLNDEKKVFNYRLSRARRCVENAFGVLAIRWRIYRRPIIANPDSVVDYVRATCVLHNFLGMNGVNLREASGQIPSLAIQDIRCTALNHAGNNSRDIRKAFSEYFMTNEGAVEWQMPIAQRGNVIID